MMPVDQLVPKGRTLFIDRLENKINLPCLDMDGELRFSLGSALDLPQGGRVGLRAGS